MISELQIKNFRSIINDRITLKPITVIIGANGSGKSNLVKALEFISDIPRNGLILAISRQGGRDSIVPKTVSRRDIRKINTEFSYTTRLLPPVREESSITVDVDHIFRLGFPSIQNVTLLHELLVFHKVLYVGQRLGENEELSEISTNSPSHYQNESLFTLSQSMDSNEGYAADPPFSLETVPLYIRWLGLDMLENKMTSPEELKKFLSSFKDQRKRQYSEANKNKSRKQAASFLDPDYPTILDFSPHFQVFRSREESIKRYDLLLNELRREQSPGRARELAKSGENMPTILRHIKKEHSESWDRLKETFGKIAPHVSDMNSSSLKTGKEFIEFIETRSGGRGVESWESSDGSLRALAILLAVETANPGDTIIIEEPEQNLHPWAIRTLLEHIRDVVDKRSVQVIITTHSEHVLDKVDPSEVRVASRTLSEGSKFLRLEQILPESNIEMGDVGRLWVKGLLGGVPDAV